MAMTMTHAVWAAVFALLLASCSGDDGGGREQTEPDASDDDGGTAGQGGSVNDAGGIVDLLRVPATVTGFSTLGEPRTDSAGDLTLSGDGFEHGERRCTANGLFCVTGGFGP